MQWLMENNYSKEFLENLDKENFPLTYKMCSKNNYTDCVVRELINQEIDHPLAIIIYKEIEQNTVNIYSIEVYKSNRLQNYGRKLLEKFKEKYDKISLCSLPDSKVFYIKQGFIEQEENRMIWNKRI